MCFRPPTADLPIKCNACNHMNDSGATVCSECGEKLQKSAAPIMSPSSGPNVPGAPATLVAPHMPVAPASPGIMK